MVKLPILTEDPVLLEILADGRKNLPTFGWNSKASYRQQMYGGFNVVFNFDKGFPGQPGDSIYPFLRLKPTHGNMGKIRMGDRGRQQALVNGGKLHEWAFMVTPAGKDKAFLAKTKKGSDWVYPLEKDWWKTKPTGYILRKAVLEGNIEATPEGYDVGGIYIPGIEELPSSTRKGKGRAHGQPNLLQMLSKSK